MLRKLFHKITPRVENSFFRAVQPMTIMALFLGTCPLTGLMGKNPKKLKFNICSFPTLWSATLFSVSLGMVFYASDQFLFDFLMTNSGNFWKVMTCWMLTARSLLQFLFCHWGARTIPNLWCILDSSHFCRKTDEVQKKMPVFIYLFMLAHLSAIFYFDYSFIESLFPKDKSVIMFSAFFSVLRIWQIMPTMIYGRLVRITATAFLEINKELNLTLEEMKLCILTKQRLEILQKAAGKLEWMRLECSLLQSAASALSKSFGTLLVVDYLVMMLVLVVQLYVIVMFEVDVFFICCAITNFVSGITALQLSHSLSSNADSILDSLRTMPVLNLDNDTRHQIQIFQTQIALQPVKISGGGFFALNKKRIVAMMGTVATYLIVLLEYGDMITKEAGVSGNNTMVHPGVRTV